MNIIKTNLKYRNPLIPLALNKVFFIVLHHLEATTATPEEIHLWHLGNGWSGFAYSEYIKKDGTVYIGRGDHVGAHTRDMNSKSYGIAVEGNYEKEPQMPTAQFNSLVERISFNKNRFPNKVEVAQHKQFNNTSCPGKYFPMNELMEALGNSTRVAILKLAKEGILSSPEYWLRKAKKGEMVDGEYASILIKKFAEKL